VKQPAIRILFGISIALAIYVLYAHISSWRRSGEYRAEPLIVAFSSEEATRKAFTIEAAPSLHLSFEDGRLHVKGACEKAGDRVVLRGAPRRLIRSRTRMRFRYDAPSPVEVMTGIARADDPTREVRFGGALDGDSAEPRAVGDRTPIGPRAEGDRVLARMSSPRMRVGADAPWTEAALYFEPDIFAAITAIDGVILESVAAGWDIATLVQPTFSVTCQKAAPGVDVEIAEAAWEPVWRETTVRKIEDDFNGKVFDPMWRVTRADEELLDSAVTIGHGLEVTAKPKHLTGPASAFAITSIRVPAESFHASAEAEVRALKKGGVYIGVTNGVPNPAFFRMFDVGVFERDGKLVPFTNGHVPPHTQAAFATYEKAFPELPAATGALTLDLRFDAKTRKARAAVNGVTVVDEAISLQPYEEIVFHLGLNADGPETDVNVVTRRLVFERFP
jgi:hypothetical protein